MDFGSYMAKLNARDFDSEVHSYFTDPSVGGFKQSWSTAGFGKEGGNYGSYSNPAVDALLDSATNAFDPARTKSYARRAFETIIEDAPGIWLYEPPNMAGISRRIRTPNLNASNYLAGMGDWWIPAGERSARDRIGLRPTP
jgi:peptide/nickel transport system substrate-binding protein